MLMLKIQIMHLGLSQMMFYRDERAKMLKKDSVSLNRYTTERQSPKNFRSRCDILDLD